MPLNYSLVSPSALYRKLERESYRAFHAESPVHKSDHFFNFCVTAHSMRDFCLEHLGKIQNSDQQSFHELWNKEPVLVAATEIANSSKHFVLRSRPARNVKTTATKAVRPGTAKYISVYRSCDGELHFKPTIRAEVRVELSDGTVLALYFFTDCVLGYWRKYLAGIGINVRRVSLRHHSVP